MNLYFFTEARFHEKDGVIYSHAGFSYDLWQRYLHRFDHVYVVGRGAKVTMVDPNMEPNTSPNVTYVLLPHYIGPIGYLKNRAAIRNQIENLVHFDDAYICRVPGKIGSLAATILKRKNIPYAVEVVGDPEESLSKSALGNNSLAPIFRCLEVISLKKTVQEASAALYVTNYILQQKYPVKTGVFVTNASNVILKNEHYTPMLPVLRKDWGTSKLNILAVGTLAQLYKAPDIVLKALAIVKQSGLDFSLIWCGNGKYLKPMQDLSESLGLSNEVSFVGQVNMSSIRKYLMESDLLIHASRAEGLPRAVIEAMAMGLPCIGSRVAGIPELLDEDALVDSDDIPGLVDKIIQFASNRNFAQEHAIRNYEEAKKYHNDILMNRRLVFFDEIIKRAIDKKSL